jgi:hypothetical protein
MTDIWMLKKEYNYSPVRFIRRTAACVFYDGGLGTRELRAYNEKFFDWQGDEATAKLLAGKLNSAKSEAIKRQSAVRKWLKEEEQRIVAKVQS